MKIIMFRRLTIKGWRWFWKALAGNHKSVAIGGEGYRNRLDALDAIAIVKRDFPAADVETVR
ncbi:DUF1508 domain-containing protein [Sphingomonas sp. LY160]|uniref:DUF1508 domain-containing protein n=1 Tax=Sphingomonas sp. LY160 TaxID=3095342 RepID=UPI002ADEE1B8|nr:DUF1508 domain-containing protein [Sphingomonas sp. LY160]MEA1071297.1 DUF1508 domain-containing protein [Sphingomonas sp. LY160]